jgi:hypothetical protein
LAKDRRKQPALAIFDRPDLIKLRFSMVDMLGFVD